MQSERNFGSNMAWLRARWRTGDSADSPSITGTIHRDTRNVERLPAQLWWWLDLRVVPFHSIPME
jgi:hypothetical protein